MSDTLDLGPARAAFVKVVRVEYHKRLLEETNAAYARPRADPVAWAEELAERALWEVTLADGLEPEEA
jgi:hypothetical protein